MRAYWLIGAIAIVPRLIVLLYERGSILTRYTEKSDDFARTFVAHGTYGFVPGEPSAYTQPLYGFFLAPLYRVFGRHWLVVGVAQIAVAAATAVLVYELGRHMSSSRVGIVAALIATLDPYLVWHDVHVNREIIDQLLAAGLVLCTLVAAERRSIRLSLLAGALAGLAILGNSRLAVLPLVLAAYLLWRAGRAGVVAALALLVVAVLTVSPWLIRNKVELGCFALTTDARALWKANNLQTYGVLAHGGWIDDVKDLPRHPLNPEEARDLYLGTGRKVHVRECANMGFYQHRVWRFWREHPAEKAELLGQAVRMEWDPRPTTTTGREGRGGGLDRARTWVEPIYASLLFALGLAGLLFAPRRYTVLALSLLAYQTFAALIFAGATRYRVPWDFLIAILAAVAIVRTSERWASRGAAR